MMGGMLGILLFQSVVLIVMDQFWEHYGWPTIVGIIGMVLGLGAWVALVLVERRIEARR